MEMEGSGVVEVGGGVTWWGGGDGRGVGWWRWEEG